MVFAEKTIVIIPTYNERDNIVALVKKIFSLIPEISILIVDDNSPDGTGKEVEKLARVYPRLFLEFRTSDRGFGRSYLAGFKRIISNQTYEAVVMMDADFSHNPAEIPAMVGKLANYNIVNGSRYITGGKIENWRLKRKILSRFANFYARTILNLPIKDLTTGFVCFRKSALKNLDLDSIKSDGYAFLVELKYRLVKNGHHFTEHPIIFTERREGQSKMSVKIIWESIWLPWKIRFL